MLFYTTGKYDQVRINFANPDMVGHTGDLAATVSCCALVDQCVKVGRSKKQRCLLASTSWDATLPLLVATAICCILLLLLVAAAGMLRHRCCCLPSQMLLLYALLCCTTFVRACERHLLSVSACDLSAS